MSTDSATPARRRVPRAKRQPNIAPVLPVEVDKTTAAAMLGISEDVFETIPAEEIPRLPIGSGRQYRVRVADIEAYSLRRRAAAVGD